MFSAVKCFAVIYWTPVGHSISDLTSLYAVHTVSNAYIGVQFVSTPAERASVSQHMLMQSVPAKCFHQQCMHCATVVCACDKHVMINEHKCVPVHEHKSHWLVSHASWRHFSTVTSTMRHCDHHTHCSTVVWMPAGRVTLSQLRGPAYTQMKYC